MFSLFIWFWQAVTHIWTNYFSFSISSLSLKFCCVLKFTLQLEWKSTWRWENMQMNFFLKHPIKSRFYSCIAMKIKMGEAEEVQVICEGSKKIIIQSGQKIQSSSHTTLNWISVGTSRSVSLPTETCLQKGGDSASFAICFVLLTSRKLHFNHRPPSAFRKTNENFTGNRGDQNPPKNVRNIMLMPDMWLLSELKALRLLKWFR